MNNMDEHKLAERFCQDIESRLQGTGTENPTGPTGEDYEKTVELAELLMQADFDDECRAQQKLQRKRLLEMFAARKVRHTRNMNSMYGEIADSELDNVAGGTQKGRNDCCALCGCKRNARTIRGDTCPDCGHPRECHPL